MSNQWRSLISRCCLSRNHSRGVDTSHNYTVSHLSPSHGHIWRVQSSFGLQRSAECVRVDISVPRAGGSSASDRISQHTPQRLLRLCTGGRQMPRSQNFHERLRASSNIHNASINKATLTCGLTHDGAGHKPHICPSIKCFMCCLSIKYVLSSSSRPLPYSTWLVSVSIFL